MKKLESIYNRINELNDNEISVLAIYLTTHFDRRNLFLKVIFDNFFRIIHKNHYEYFSLLFCNAWSTMTRIVCPFMSIKEICSLTSPGIDFKAVICLRDLLKANINESIDNLRLLRHWLIRNVDNLRDDNRIHAKIYMSDNGTYITSCNLSKNGTRVNKEVGVFSDSSWFSENTMPIFNEWWDGGEVLTIEKINEAFKNINNSNEKSRDLNVDAILVDMKPAEYANAFSIVAETNGSFVGKATGTPIFKDTSPKSFFTYHFISMINKLGIKEHIPNIIKSYFNIIKWQRGMIVSPAELTSVFTILASAICAQKCNLHGNHATSTIPSTALQQNLWLKSGSGNLPSS